MKAPVDLPRPTAPRARTPATAQGRAASRSLPPAQVLVSDLHGLARLGVDATVGITDLVEAVHHSIESRLGVADAASGGRTSGPIPHRRSSIIPDLAYCWQRASKPIGSPNEATI